MGEVDFNSVLIPAIEQFKTVIWDMVLAVLPYALGIFGLKYGLVAAVNFFKGLLSGHDEGAPIWDAYDASEWDMEEAHEEYYRVADGMDMGGDDPEDYSEYMHDDHDY